MRIAYIELKHNCNNYEQNPFLEQMYTMKLYASTKLNMIEAYKKYIDIHINTYPALKGNKIKIESFIL